MGKSKVVFESKNHASLKLIRDAVYEKQKVGAEIVTILVEPPAVQFSNFQVEIDSSDEVLLEFMNNHRHNGSLFYKKKTSAEKVPSAVLDAVKKSEEEKEGKVVAEEVTDTDSDGEVTADDVKNIQQAKDYLLDNYEDVDGRKINNPEKILAKAEELGVSFPNLK